MSDDRFCRRTGTSDIGLTIPWWFVIAMFASAGWPGILIGAALGALVWRAHRIIGGLIGSLLIGLPWAYERLNLGPWFGRW